MDNPLISIIVPVYNAEKYLDRCIESIVNQTYKNLEIILVDDGSTDSCPDICDGWAEKDRRINVIHKENGGVSNARNAGLDAVTGEIIGFADNDDILDSDMIEFLYKNMLDYDADISRCSYRFYYTENDSFEDSEIIEEAVVFDNSEDMLNDLYNFGYKCGVVWNRLYKGSVVGNIRFNPELKSGGEDILFNYYALKNCSKMVCCDTAKYNYSMHSVNGITGINFNYYMYIAMKEIISDKSAPLCMYYKFYVFAYMTLHDIVIRKQFADYDLVREDIVKNKKRILSTDQIKNNRKNMVRLYLIELFPYAYKRMILRANLDE